jgi:hypothetical protein
MSTLDQIVMNTQFALFGVVMAMFTGMIVYSVYSKFKRC